MFQVQRVWRYGTRCAANGDALLRWLEEALRFAGAVRDGQTMGDVRAVAGRLVVGRCGGL